MKTVFIVDDDGLLRETLRRSLEQAGYNVRSFESASDALCELDTAPPDIVVSDYQMPGMDGLEFIESVRQRSVSLPVMLMSGYVTPEVEKRAWDLGVNRVLSKPIRKPQEFVDLIEETIEAGHRRLENLNHLGLSFLTGVSHELRTPLTSIKIALDGLISERVIQDDPATKRLVEISRRNIDRIIQLVENQLEILGVSLREDGENPTEGAFEPDLQESTD